MPGWHDIALGLGGNLGDAPASIAAAVEALRADPDFELGPVSRLYRTPPWGPVPQPDFANACALASTRLAPRALLGRVKEMETRLGRVPGLRWGPRQIDIDILFYAGLDVAEPDLVIPHASLFERAFVLAPLAEIAPDRVIAGKRIAAAAAAVPRDGVVLWT